MLDLLNGPDLDELRARLEVSIDAGELREIADAADALNRKIIDYARDHRGEKVDAQVYEELRRLARKSAFTSALATKKMQMVVASKRRHLYGDGPTPLERALMQRPRALHRLCVRAQRGTTRAPRPIARRRARVVVSSRDRPRQQDDDPDLDRLREVGREAGFVHISLPLEQLLADLRGAA